MLMVDIKHFDYSILDHVKNVRRPRGNQATNSRQKYKDLVCAFDIETTRIHDDMSIMYVWQFQLDDITIIGRLMVVVSISKAVTISTMCLAAGEGFLALFFLSMILYSVNFAYKLTSCTDANNTITHLYQSE